MSFLLAFVTSILISSVRSDCNDGWSSCDSSIWVSPKFVGENPDVLDSYTPGEIRGPLEYEIKFSCRGRRAGYYADLDHRCKVWHYCNTTRELNPINGLSTWTYMHFSYACTEEGTRYDQVLKECIPESRALVGCRESELYYPTGEYVHDVPITIQSNNRLVPVRCPQSPVRCHVQKDHIRLSLCPDAPGAVVKFYSDITSESDVSSTGPSLAYGTRELTSPAEDEESAAEDDAPSTDAPGSTAAPLANPVPLANRVPHPPAQYIPIAVPAKTNPGKDSDSSKTNPFRFHQTPAAAARKTAQTKGQPTEWFAPPKRVISVIPQAPIRKFVVSDLASQQFEQSKVNPAPFARKSAAAVSRKTVSFPAAGQVKTLHFYSEARKEEQTFPFIASSHQVIFPRRLTEQMEIPTILQIRGADAAPTATTSSNSTESDAAGFLGLPIGSTKILGSKIDTSFDCTGKTYGYYADVKNQCKVYHVCSPKTDEFGTKFYEHYSFVCSEGLVFDQQKLTCLPPGELSTPCSESEKFFTRTATIFKEGNDNWLLKKATTTTEAAPTATDRPSVSVEPVYVDLVPSEPLRASARKSVSQEGKDFAGYEQSIASPSRILKGKGSFPDSSQQQQEQQESVLQEGSQWSDSPYPSDNSENGQGHKPSITQTIVRSGGQRVFHNPRISQKIQSPESPADSQEISHSPSIDQYIAQPAQPTSFRSISHNPSISQYVSQPGSPSDHKIISHNPSITQYIPSPEVPSSGDQVISHNPSITQYVAGPGVQVPPNQRISHSPTISQYIPAAGSPGSSSQTISHNPSIHQVITLPEYSRPSSRS